MKTATPCKPFHRLTAIAVAVSGAIALPAFADSDLESRVKAMEGRISTLEAENRLLQTGSTADDRTTLGGYGELHLNKLNGEGGAADLDRIDFHRFVLFLGHRFSDRVSFHSELEVEHVLSSSTGPGEVELEQAYVDFQVNDSLTARGGLFLLPIGITNETHEPPTFYGVERNNVENAIIPTTWWEGGAGLSARLTDGLTLDAAITSGLRTTAANNYAVRNGRQKVANATAKDPAYTARLKWTAVPGVELAGSLHHQADITQSQDPTAGSATLFEAHTVITQGSFGLRALYAAWNLEGSGPAAVGADKQQGWYVEPAYKLGEQWGVFARYSEWDNRAGSSGPVNSEKQQTDVGVNYWPHPDVVVKLDYQSQDNDDQRNQNGFNLGIGYQF